MKTIKLTLLLASMLILSCEKQENQADEKNHQLTEKNYATKDESLFTNALLRGWSESGGCLHGYGNCAIAFDLLEYKGEQNTIPVKLSITKDNQLLINNTIYKKNEDGDELVFKNDLILPPGIAQNLKLKSIIIKKGKYSTVYQNNKLGQTFIDI